MTPLQSWRLLFKPLRPPSDVSLAFPMSLPETHRRYTYNGSAAIHAALLDMQLDAADAVLMPAYCCGAELGPFEQLGCRLHFYDVDDEFSVDLRQIARLLDSHPAIKLLFVTHYLGVPQQNIESLAELCRRRTVTLLEDCAHALYTEHNGIPAGSFGDYAIFSPRKTLPLSEGGILCGRRALHRGQTTPVQRPARIAHLGRVAYSLQQGARGRGPERSARVLRILSIAACIPFVLSSKLAKASGLLNPHGWLSPEVEGAEAVPIYGLGMSAASQCLLESADVHQIRRQRRSNHALWVQLVQPIEGAEAIHATLPDGACPLYMAVRVADPAACVARLASMDVEAFNWWQFMAPGIRWPKFPIAQRHKRSIIALPLHQQLGEADIRHMAQCLRTALRSD